MIRELGVHTSKFTPADMTAAVKMVTGMGVIPGTDGTFALPGTETAEDIRLLEREREVSGIYASVTDLDDYDEHYTTVERGTFAKLITPMVGEVYAVDQYDETIQKSDAGKRLAVGIDGKFKVAGSGVASRFVFDGFYQDGTHQLVEFSVADTAAANA